MNYSNVFSGVNDSVWKTNEKQTIELYNIFVGGRRDGHVSAGAVQTPFEFIEISPALEFELILIVLFSVCLPKTQRITMSAKLAVRSRIDARHTCSVNKNKQIGYFYTTIARSGYTPRGNIEIGLFLLAQHHARHCSHAVYKT